MSITLIAAADEPRPQQPPTPPQPRTPEDPPRSPIAAPWWQTRHRIAQHRRGTNPIPQQRAAEPFTGPNVFTIAICGGCGALPGDWCDCSTDTDEVARALAAPIIWPLGGAR
jgi:hypothetical protein